MDHPNADRTGHRLRLSQETIAMLTAIVTVGVALAALILTITSDIRAEARADRATWQTRSAEIQAAWQKESAEIQAAWQKESAEIQAAWQAESRQLRNEAAADREAFQAQILRLTERQASLSARVENHRHQ